MLIITRLHCSIEFSSLSHKALDAAGDALVQVSREVLIVHSVDHPFAPVPPAGTALPV